jgi:hypothetical protein
VQLISSDIVFHTFIFSLALKVPFSEMLLMTLSSLLLGILENSLLPITDVTSREIVDCMLRFSRSRNTRLKNLATIFLEDYCTPEQVAEATGCEVHPVAVEDIPVPGVGCVPERRMSFG